MTGAETVQSAASRFQYTRRLLEAVNLQGGEVRLSQVRGVQAVSRAFLTVVIFFVVLHLVLIALFGGNTSTRLFGAAVAGCALLLIAWFLIAAGRTRLGTWLGAITALLVGLFAGWFAAYIGIAQAAWVFVAVTYSTLVLGMGAGVLATTFSLVAYALLAVAINYGEVRPQLVPNAFNQWLNLFTPSMVLLSSTGLIREALVEAARRQADSAAAAAREREERLLLTQKHAQQLEQTVEARTTALETAIKDPRTLTYLLSHDLMGKIAAIRTFAGVVTLQERDTMSSEGLRRLGRIEANAEQLQRMIDSLLIYSRASTLQPAIEWADVEKLVGSIVHDLRQTYPRVAMEWQAFPLRTDGVMLRHIIQNLLANACKYAKGEEPRIRLSAEKEGNQVVLCVADNGPGFDAADSGLLFSLFERGKQESGDGHGVGLAVVKHLTEKLGGRAWAHSTGDGARFYFSLPEDY